MFIYTDKDGKFVKVEGDPDHPISQGRLCPRCLAMGEFLQHPDRIRYPMKRAREDRGKDAWERITWDEALDILEREVRKIWANYGPEAIYLFQGTGREATLYAPPMAQACFKTPNCSFSMSGGSCYGPRTVVADFLLGAGYPELDYAAYFPDRYDEDVYKRQAVVSPAITASPSSCPARPAGIGTCLSSKLAGSAGSLFPRRPKTLR